MFSNIICFISSFNYCYIVLVILHLSMENPFAWKRIRATRAVASWLPGWIGRMARKWRYIPHIGENRRDWLNWLVYVGVAFMGSRHCLNWVQLDRVQLDIEANRFSNMVDGRGKCIVWVWGALSYGPKVIETRPSDHHSPRHMLSTTRLGSGAPAGVSSCRSAPGAWENSHCFGGFKCHDMALGGEIRYMVGLGWQKKTHL